VTGNGEAGGASHSGQLRILTLALALVAATVAVGGLFLPVALPDESALTPAARFGLAASAVVLAQLARLRLRVATGLISVTWGEAAFIVGLHLVPASWLPAATLLGTSLAWTLLALITGNRSLFDVLHTVACLTVAVGLGAGTVALLGDPFAAAPTPPIALALVVGSLVYLLTTVGLVAWTMALRMRVPVPPVLRGAVHGKAVMFVGNVLIGLAMISMIGRDPRWLLLLPPALWLLQQTYRHRLQVDDERRTWRALAEATGALNQLDERAVARAGVRGALSIFDAESAEVEVIRRDGRRRRYRGEPDSEITDWEVPAFGRGEAGRSGHHELGRVLVVGAVHVGELRVRLPRTARPGQRDRDALAAYGDALAAALHDAATHRELRSVAARSSYEAVHDPLTSLVNRAAMLAKGDLALHQLGHDHPVALLLLDINHFKEVNDTLGHAAGDELLRITADRLAAFIRPGELLGRLGGDEFALLISNLPGAVPAGASAEPGGERAPLAQAMRRAREVAERLATPVEIAGVRISVEVSVGVVVAGAGAADMTELLRRADIAMYQAKDGGDSVVPYDGTRDAASTDQLALLAELREALSVDDQLVLALQPAVDLTTGEPTGVEALIRWQHPRRGVLGPAEFMRTIEGSDLLGAFTRYVIDKALAVAADWGRQGLDIPISINLSARSLLDSRLPAEVAESLHRHRVPPHRLVLEITETVVMSELEVIDEVLAELRALGVQLAVDDFGTGFSSLTFLTRIAVDELKVDRSFVMRMAESPEAAAIVRTTVDLGRTLGLRVIAEGVETAEQRSALAKLGCTAAQGYHFCKPMPSDKIAGVLRSLRDATQARILPIRADGAS
jgi:diguanylate cyclase (GGDEF)-like protein